jgi:hypothetical protein
LPKPIVLSTHAERVMIERELQREWIDAAIQNPEWTEPDPSDPALERRFLPISDREGRILRVVCAENDDMILVVTAFLDRDARRPA